jgi:DNA-binding SARP family transcriptional activator
VAPEDSQTGPVAYRALGPLTALRDGREIDLGPPKQRAVLGLLLLRRGHVVSVDRLVDAVWPQDPPASVATSLQVYVSNLRRLLRADPDGPPPIVRRPPGYVLEAGETDLEVFATAAASARTLLAAEDWDAALAEADRALALVRGPLLEDLTDEPWVRAEADGWADLVAEARETRTVALLAQGALVEAIRQAQALCVEQPLRDRSCWLLMVALHRAGRSPEALERYREHLARLDEQLGLEPGAELRELQVAILRQDPTLAAWPRPAQWSGAAAVTSPAVAVAPIETDLVGRGPEAAEIDRLVGEAGAGQVRWLLLTGPAGIGKTRLAEEVVRRAGGRHAWARCAEEAGAPAWWPVRQIARALDADPDALLARAPEVDTDAARFAIYERVVALLEAVDTPLTVVVDDVQWADSTSARCLAYVAGALRGRPITFVLTYRDGEPDEDVRPLLAAIARSDGHRHLAVGPLGDDAVRELADRVAVAPLDDAEAVALAQRTGGNPLFVREYARLSPQQREGIPLAVRSVLGRRLDGLDPDVLHVLQAAAVLDDVLDVGLLAATTGIERDAIADHLDAAADENLIVAAPGTGGYAFAHGLLRDEVLAQIPPSRVQRQHLRVAAVLAGRAGEPSRRAQHLVLAQPLADPADVVEACRAAATEATERFSTETAAEWWGEALRAFDREPPPGQDRDELLIARVEALARAGRGQTMLDVVADELLSAARDQRTRTAGLLAASLLRATGAWPWVSSGDPRGLIERLELLEPLLDTDPAAQARVLAAMAVASSYDRDPAVPDTLSRRAIALADALGDDEVLADTLLGRLVTYSGLATHCEEELALFARLSELRYGRARVDAAIGHSIASTAAFMRGDVAGAERHVRRGIAEAELQRLPVVRAQLRWMQAMLAEWHGDRAEADHQLALATEVHAQTELHGAAAAAELARLFVAWTRGTLPPDTPLPVFEPVAWAAALAFARGDHDTAAAEAARWIGAQGPLLWTTLSHAVLLGHVVADLDRADLATPYIALLTPFSGRIAVLGQGPPPGLIDLALARLHDLRGDEDRAAELLAAATRLAEETDGRPTAERCRRLALRDSSGADQPPPSPGRDNEVHEHP